MRNDDDGETIRPGFVGEPRCVGAIRLELFLQLLLFAAWRGAAVTSVVLERREAPPAIPASCLPGRRADGFTQHGLPARARRRRHPDCRALGSPWHRAFHEWRCRYAASERC